MNLRSFAWKGVCATLCLNTALVLGEDPKPKSVTIINDGAFNVRYQVVTDSDGGTLEVVSDETPAGQPPVDVLTQVLTPNNSGLLNLAVNTESQGKYWIGLLCTPPTEALRAQLELAANTGLVVEEVSEGGPAGKAGIQRFDVLLSAIVSGKAESEARALSNLTDLINVVQAAETSPLKVELLRRGKKQTLELSPEERPKQAFVVGVTSDSPAGVAATHKALGLRWAGPMIVNLAAAPVPEGMTIEFQPAEGPPQKVIVTQKEQTWETDVKALDKLPEEIGVLVRQQLDARLAATRSAMAYRMSAVTAPSLVVHGAVTPLPDDVSVTVVRKGTAPAKITIKKGDQTWEATDQDLSKLPKEIRPIADSVLLNHATPGRALFTTAMPVPPSNVSNVAPQGAGTIHFNRTRIIQPTTGVSGTISTTPSTIQPSISTQADIQRQLKELSEQVEKLRLAVEKNQPKQ